MNLSEMQIILDHATEGFVLIDVQGRIRAFNRRTSENVFHNGAGTINVNDSIFDFVSPERRGEYAALLSRIAQGETIEYRQHWQRPGDKKVWFEFLLSPVWQKDQVTAICIRSRDITANMESELLYHSLFEQGPVPMFVCNRKTLQYLEVNDAAVAHYGYSRQELLTMSPFDIRVESEHSALQYTIEQGPLVWDRSTIGTHRKKNGQLIKVQVALHPIDYKGVEASLVVVSDITELLTLQEQLAGEKLGKQRDVTRATIQAQEKERSMLGRELHDNVNQMLSSAKLFLSYAVTRPPDQLDILEKSMDTIENAIQEIRKLSRSLLPPTLGDLGLPQALKELVKGMALANGKVRVKGFKELYGVSLSGDLQLCIYRIVQEQLSNVVKYAECTAACVSFEYADETLSLTVSDNGRGFDVRAKRKGIGLTNIVNRASAFNGAVQVVSSPGKGTTLTVKFPNVQPATVHPSEP